MMRECVKEERLSAAAVLYDNQTGGRVDLSAIDGSNQFTHHLAKKREIAACRVVERIDGDVQAIVPIDVIDAGLV